MVNEILEETGVEQMELIRPVEVLHAADALITDPGTTHPEYIRALAELVSDLVPRGELDHGDFIEKLIFRFNAN